MRRSPILGALLLPLVALACESDNATEESILAPPGPSFSHVAITGCSFLSLGVREIIADHRIVVIGTTGEDFIQCAGASVGVTVRGLGGDDIISGSAFDDNLFGNGGCDVVFGADGNDFIDLGPGDDSGICRNFVAGGYGDDGNDHIKGGPGDDFINGRADNDLCEGGPGTDSYTQCEVCNDPNSDCGP